METFILDTEQICGRKSMSLRGALQSQANRFVNRFHEERKTKLRYLSGYCYNVAFCVLEENLASNRIYLFKIFLPHLSP